MNTTVVLNRKEMEFSVSGIMYPQYPKPDIKHLVDRIYEPEAMRFLDLEISLAEEIIPGVWCECSPAEAAYSGRRSEEERGNAAAREYTSAAAC